MNAVSTQSERKLQEEERGTKRTATTARIFSLSLSTSCLHSVCKLVCITQRNVKNQMKKRQRMARMMRKEETEAFDANFLARDVKEKCPDVAEFPIQFFSFWNKKIEIYFINSNFKFFKSFLSLHTE